MTRRPTAIAKLNPSILPSFVVGGRLIRPSRTACSGQACMAPHLPTLPPRFCAVPEVLIHALPRLRQERRWRHPAVTLPASLHAKTIHVLHAACVLLIRRTVRPHSSTALSCPPFCQLSCCLVTRPWWWWGETANCASSPEASRTSPPLRRAWGLAMAQGGHASPDSCSSSGQPAPAMLSRRR